MWIRGRDPPQVPQIYYEVDPESPGPMTQRAEALRPPSRGKASFPTLLQKYDPERQSSSASTGYYVQMMLLLWLCGKITSPLYVVYIGHRPHSYYIQQDVLVVSKCCPRDSCILSM